VGLKLKQGMEGRPLLQEIRYSFGTGIWPSGPGKTPLDLPLLTRKPYILFIFLKEFFVYA